MNWLLFLILLIPVSTRADRINGQPSLNPKHVITMNEASVKKAKKVWSVKDGKRFLDRTGVTYGKLTAISVTRYNVRNQTFWLCICGCGKECEVFSGNLNSGHTTSCGCEKGLLTHGENRVGQRTAEYSTLNGILQRCKNPNSASFKDYGGRGIRVTEEWDELWKFPAFLAYMGRRPSPQHSIDRWPDKNGHYEPGNVRWATCGEQSRNMRSNVMLTFGEETLCRKDMAKKYGMSSEALKKRLERGMSLEEALMTPINQKMQRFKKV